MIPLTLADRAGSLRVPGRPLSAQPAFGTGFRRRVVFMSATSRVAR